MPFREEVLTFMKQWSVHDDLHVLVYWLQARDKGGGGVVKPQFWNSQQTNQIMDMGWFELGMFYASVSLLTVVYCVKIHVHQKIEKVHTTRECCFLGSTPPQDRSLLVTNTEKGKIFLDILLNQTYSDQCLSFWNWHLRMNNEFCTALVQSFYILTCLEFVLTIAPSLLPLSLIHYILWYPHIWTTGPVWCFIYSVTSQFMWCACLCGG